MQTPCQKELSDAFVLAQRWEFGARKHDPLNGFGKGHEWGEHILDVFMPKWFQRYIEDQNYHPVCLLGGLKGFLRWSEGCGIPEEMFWRFAEMFYSYHKKQENS